ncbi:TonB-dependent receptor [Luteimonas sp. Y-2-2-4F]|nr:TonB-dependent receptor [Luteimonas sp. Y-2-2-4F]MCD9030616.1 TonB-dependent receptor [Luteimonas sp. Y-2-2-4F]
MPFPTHLPRLRATLLAIALAAALPAVAHAADLDALPDRTERTDLPAGPLGRSLGAFASRHGVALSFDPALTEGLQAPALQGEYSARSGFERLLTGSGLRLLPRADGSYTLVRAPAAGSGAIAMPSLRIGGQRTFPYSEGMVLDEDYIQSQAKGNGDIATLLRINPAVQFEDARSTSSRQAGEIRPADFSINGALPYQNLLLLDGIGFNNDIEPGASFNPHVVAEVPAPYQGIAVDTDLLERLTVYDSNVPVAFGGFTGGVVDARTRRAQDAFGGKLYFRMSRSVWNELIVPEGNQDSFVESSIWQNQPVYDKYKLGVMLEGRTRNGIGLIGNISRTRSDIPLRGYSAGNVSENDELVKEQRRENTSISLRADWSPTERISASANLTHAPTDERYFTQNAKNSYFDLKQGGPVAGLRLGYAGNAWTFDNSLSYSDLDSSRRVDAGIDYWKAWARSEEHDWGVNNSSFEGNWGNIDQATRTLAWKFTADREELRIGPTAHNLQFGLEYRDRKAHYHRLNDHYSFLDPVATTSCEGPGGVVDTDSCSLSPVARSSWDSRGNPILAAGQGQFFTTRNVYSAGEFDVHVRELAAFVQDDIRLGRWSLRAGLRLDSDDMMDKDTIAPRLAVSWDVLGDQDTILTAGANRYYGRNFFGYKLREGRENLQTEYERGSIEDEWTVARRYTANNRFEELDIPYNDELALGLSQRWSRYGLDFKYIRREGRDELLRERVPSEDGSGYYSNQVYQYVNKGRSSSDTFTLSVDLQQPWRLGPSVTQAQLALDHTDIRRNYSSYDTTYNTGTYDRLVRYEGDLIRAYELPQDGYNRPWSARLSTQTRLENWGLLWSNFLRWRAGHTWFATVGSEDYQDGEETVSIDVIEKRENPSGWTWDSTLEYGFRLRNDQEAYVRVEVQNLLNRNLLLTSSTSDTTAFFEPGRSYWLEVGYRF